jgi:hypothetical protein
VGPTCRRGEEEAGYRFGGGVLLGRGLLLELGQIVSPGALLYFISPLLLFPFLISLFLQILSNLIQKDSDQLCKVSKIQNNHTEQ